MFNSGLFYAIMENATGITLFLVFIGGLGVFIYGMKLMSEGLLKITGRGVRQLFSYLTNKPFVGIVTGFVVTALIQSSSATSVIVISLVNTSLLTLKQSVGVIMGANIGTTVTSWIISLLGFKLESINFSLIIMGIAFPMIFSKLHRWRSTGEFWIGFSFMLLGLTFMKDAIPDLSDNTDVLSFLKYYEVNFLSSGLSVLLGIALTIIVQSSSVAVGMVQIMAFQGIVPFELAASMLIGSNIGTTVTTNIASIVGTKESKQAARIHSLINIFGAIWMMLALNPFIKGVDWCCLEFLDTEYSVFSTEPNERGQVMPIALATFHTGFNVLNVLLLVWFIPFLVKISKYLVSKGESYFSVAKLDKNYIVEIPELEILEAKGELLKLSKVAQDIYMKVSQGYQTQSVERSFLDEIDHDIDELKSINARLINYLTTVFQEHPSADTSEILVNMGSITSDMKEIGLTCHKISELVYNKTEKRLVIDEKIFRSLNQMFALITEGFDFVVNDIYQNSKVDTDKYQVLEEKIHHLQNHLEMIQIARLRDQANVEAIFLSKDIALQLSLLTRQLYRVSEKLSTKSGKNW